MKNIYPFLKRIIDIVGSLIGLVFCFVILWIWSLIINILVTKGHPFFVQKRIGKNKKVFGLIKFRSMKLDANPNLAPSEIDINKQKSMETKFGSFLRKTSIDETPQLLNILIGQMSFVGPRPGAAVNEEELIKEREKYKPNAFDVKPGLTGIAQISSNRSHNPVIKAKYDHEYVVKMSLLLDIKIFILTVIKVFTRKDGAR